MVELPRLYFHQGHYNHLEQRFYGKVEIQHAYCYLSFHKNSIVQTLLHNFKYKGNKDIGTYIGRWFGIELIESGLQNEWDGIVPVPIHKSRQKKRGFNQSLVFAEGLAEALSLPIYTNVLIREKINISQTRKSRIERWTNVEKAFTLQNNEPIQKKRILLADDVITTGATLEACALALLQAGASSVSIVTIAAAI
ncbi:MAG: ComF family protein [Cyclobacteriaceae bacterium]|nr:ComF family protein [Cyclobacteriaceae bacterium]